MSEHLAHTIPFDELYVELERSVKTGLVEKIEIFDDLIQYVYTDACELGNHWNKYNMCATGIILCPTKKKIIVTTIPKMFSKDGTKFSKEDAKPILITEKIYGRPINLFYYDDEWKSYPDICINNHAYELFSEDKLNKLDKHNTYIFVVEAKSYDELIPVLITVYSNKGRELSYTERYAYAEILSIKLPKTIRLSLDDFKQSTVEWIVQYKNGLRTKMSDSLYRDKLIQRSPITTEFAMERLRKYGETTPASLPSVYHYMYEQKIKALQECYHILLNIVIDWDDKTNQLTSKEVLQLVSSKLNAPPRIVRACLYHYKKGHDISKIIWNFVAEIE